MAKTARRIGNLPAEATSFIGRRRGLAELRKKLSIARLVTLVGPGGVGKSRLALRAAGALGRAFPGGAWWVELAEVRDPALVPNAVLAALDLRDQAGTAPSVLLLTHLKDRELLLVLDNCEHLLDSAARLAGEIMRGAPSVRIVATSREPLSAQGEHVLPVPPLELPSPHAREPLQRLRQNEAVGLFVERADAASGAFELTESNRAAVADLCRHLDGLPLAIELAAVRTRVLSVEQILDRLANRFDLLTGGSHVALPRHQTLETAIDWSYDLLTPVEQGLFRRLSVFAGRFTLEDVQAISGTHDVLDAISSLVDKSLVIKEAARTDVACYHLHETMREYAERRLAEAGEKDSVDRLCTDYYVGEAQEAALQARFRLPEWLAWVELEIENMRAVLRRCLVEKDSRNGIQLATSLSWFWITRATTEGVRWLDELLASGPGNPETIAWSYFIRGFLAVLQGDYEAARPVLDSAIAAARAASQPVQLTNSLAMAAIAAVMAGDRATAAQRLEEADDLTSELEDVPARVSVLQARSLIALFGGDFETLRAASIEGGRMSREVDDLYAVHMMSLNLGGAAMLAGDRDEARRCYTESLRIAHRIDDRIGQYYVLAAIAYDQALRGHAKDAARLLGASETIRTGAGATPMAVIVPIMVQARDAAIAALGPERFEVEVETGRHMSRDAAVALAIGEAVVADSDFAGRHADGGGVLAKREVQVARLIAEGLSNKQIGARLFISERTVDSHVRSILDKFGFNSRAQIAGWVSSAER
jgi:predicted ATPase/DNA-binding CsgD family transcriptional regulator